jgi:ParB/RepB/Spo0J family partition protein
MPGQTVAVKDIYPDPQQPRKHFDEGYLLGLGQNMARHGQQVPVIVHADGSRFVLLDGERRWRAAQLAGIAELDAVVLAKKPTPVELRILQMSIDVHKVAHSLVERSDTLKRIQDETGWSVGELAERLSLKQPHVSKLLGLQRLVPSVRELVNSGGLDIEKAFVISQEPDRDRQSALAQEAGRLSREQFRRRARNQPERPEVKVALARFMVAADRCVTVQAPSVTLGQAIDLLGEAVKELKKGLVQGLDISTQQRVMRDRVARKQSA